MHIFIYTYLFLARQCSCLSVFEWDNVVKLISHGCGAASGWGPASPRRKSASSSSASHDCGGARKRPPTSVATARWRAQLSWLHQRRCHYTYPKTKYTH